MDAESSCKNCLIVNTIQQRDIQCQSTSYEFSTIDDLEKIDSCVFYQ